MNNYTIISDIEKIDIKNWKKFIINHDKGNIFQTPFFFNINDEINNHNPFISVLLNRNNELVGVLLGVTISYFGINSVITSRDVIIGGPVVLNNDEKLISMLLDNYASINSKNVLFTEIRNINEQLNENDAYQKSSFKFNDHLNFLIDLSVTKNDLWLKISRSKRKLIRKSEKLGVYFVEVDIEDFSKLEEGYAILYEVYQRARLPLPKIDIFKNAVKESNDDYRIKIFSVYVENKMVGVRFALIFKKDIYGWYAGSYSEFYNYYPNELLAWKTIEWGLDSGFRKFDYGGAGKPNDAYGVRDFKSKFGGELVNFGRYKRIHKPLLLNIAELGFKLKQKIS